MNARLLLAGVLLAVACTAHAGRSCDPKPPDAQAVARGLALAGRVAQRLDGAGADVVVMGRVGQDLARYGQRYSHLAFAYRDGAGWRVVHKLNACGTDRAAVFRQGLGEFFLDDPFDFEAGIVPLRADVAARLLPVLRDNGQLARLHDPDYSMLAYPWAQRYQQSNQWLIETLAMAEDADAATRARAQAWLRLKDYRPATVQLGTFERLGARLTQANVAFDDHPDDLRYSGRIVTVTADSVFAWLERSGLGSRRMVVR